MRKILEVRANEMRRSPTPAESLLYLELLKALEPYRATLKSQEPVGYYIADFMIYPSRVIVECDGAHHREHKGIAYDRRRDTALRELGIRTLRFSNGDILATPTKVVAQILDYCRDSLMLKDGDLGEVKVTQCPPAKAGAGRKKARADYYKRLLAFNARFQR